MIFIMQKKFYSRLLSAIAIIILLTTSCKKSSPSEPNYSSVHTYEEALERWNSLNIHDYTMRQRCSIVWGPNQIKDIMNIFVNKDTIMTVSYPSGLQLDSNLRSRYKPIVQLFHMISQLKNADTAAFEVYVVYDSLLGYPINFGMYSKPPVGPTDVGFSYFTCCPKRVQTPAYTY
jgi:hypothetical protein